MTDAVLLALIGVGGTLLGTLGGALLQWSMQRGVAREERREQRRNEVLKERARAYATLHTVSAQVEVFDDERPQSLDHVTNVLEQLEEAFTETGPSLWLQDQREGCRELSAARFALQDCFAPGDEPYTAEQLAEHLIKFQSTMEKGRWEAAREYLELAGAADAPEPRAAGDG